jgi:hypothetical protein
MDTNEIKVPTEAEVMAWLMTLPDDHLFGYDNDEEYHRQAWGEVCLVGQVINQCNPGRALSAGYTVVYESEEPVAQLDDEVGYLASIFDRLVLGERITAGELREKLGRLFLYSVLAHVDSLGEA